MIRRGTRAKPKLEPAQPVLFGCGCQLFNGQKILYMKGRSRGTWCKVSHAAPGRGLFALHQHRASKDPGRQVWKTARDLAKFTN
ncbi:Hypothetical protein NTJ_01930 [Nesidiocoris tenuis]|uniref:FLYWCH-type domain-containing protein n=1 Tax=Nesidiocoris tenuis TaxID=355587 RepID=A0ABN7AAU0_9HEMI|nr:Hypothetical protein NTJ_01930 [Nesidiocoris tenuis]